MKGSADRQEFFPLLSRCELRFSLQDQCQKARDVGCCEAGGSTTVSEATSNQATVDPSATKYAARCHQVRTFLAAGNRAAAAVVLHSGTLPLGGANHHDTIGISWRR